MYCSRCGKKVLDSMLYCPFCGAEIIIPDQDPEKAAEMATPEPIRVEPVFSFDIPDEPEEAPAPAEPEPDLPEPEPEPKLNWEDLIDREKTSEPEPQAPEEAVEPEPPKQAPLAEENSDDFGSTGHYRRRRSAETLVPDKALVIDKETMFMDDADDFDRDDDLDGDEYDDEYDDEDDFDEFEEELERQERRQQRHQKREKKREERRRTAYEDEEVEHGFIFRHIRGIVGILMFLVLIAALMIYALSEPGQMKLAKINATLPLRADIYSRIAYEYYQSQDYAQSGVYYERALSRDPDSYNYASSAAMAYLTGGNNDKAAEMLRKCIQLKPQAVEPYVYLLNLYPNAASRPWDVTQLLKQGYELTGDARLQEAASDGVAQG